MKKCPFNNENCTPECSLFINSAELNELVKNKLTSIGVLTQGEGTCSLKNIALGVSRYMFETTTTNRL